MSSKPETRVLGPPNLHILTPFTIRYTRPAVFIGIRSSLRPTHIVITASDFTIRRDAWYDLAAACCLFGKAGIGGEFV